MNRSLACVFALLLTMISISSACFAGPDDRIGFTLRGEYSGREQIKADFRVARNGRGNNQWSSSFLPSRLVGLDLGGFRAGGAHPLRFAVIRDAGRLDCAGSGGGFYASASAVSPPTPASPARFRQAAWAKRLATRRLP